jgi:hypothetical protein
MNSARGKYPEAFVHPQSDFSDQTFQTRNCRVCGQNAKAKETLACLVVYAISSFLHLSVGSMAIELNLPTSGQIKLTMRYPFHEYGLGVDRVLLPALKECEGRHSGWKEAP